MNLRTKSVAATILAASFAASAQAGIEGYLARVTVTTANGESGFLEIGLQSGIPAGGDVTFFTGGGDIFDTETGALLATVEDLTGTYIGDPAINLAFAILAGSSDISVTITSGLLTFPSISGTYAEARATSSYAITDVNGDGSFVTPLGGGVGVDGYRAFLNGTPGSGTLFSGQLGALSAPAGVTSDADSEDFPGGGLFAPVGYSIVSASAGYAFEMSAFDRASGTSSFVIIPTPATGVLIGAGLFAAARRRR